MKKIVRNVVLTILVLILVVVIGFSAFIGRQVFDGVTNVASRESTLTKAAKYESVVSDLAGKYDVEKLFIKKDNDSQTVPALFVTNPGNKNIVVMVHGMGGSKETLAPLMDGFLEMGYDIIAYDQRNSGENTQKYNTSGVLESDDTLAVLDYIVPDYKNDFFNGNVILWGQSYGAITSTIAAGKDDSKIDFLILESPISDGSIMIENVMRTIAEDQGIPLEYLMSVGDWYSKAAIDVGFGDMDATSYIKNVSKPVLITNSLDDTLTPPYMAEELFKAISHDKKEHHTVKGLKHGQLPFNENEMYMNIIREFLKDKA